jgi:signal transduction histidine kinase
MVVLATFSIVAVGWMSYTIAEKTLTEQAKEQLKINTLAERNHFEHDLFNFAVDLRFISNEQSFLDNYGEIYRCSCQKEESCNSSEQTKSKVRDYLRNYLEYRPSFASILIACPNGEIVVSTNEIDEGKSVAQREAFAGSSSEKPFISPPKYDIKKQETVMDFSTPIRNGNESSVLIATTNRLELSSYLYPSERPTSEETYLVSNFHQFITLPKSLDNNYDQSVSTEATKNCFSSGEGDGIYENYKGDRVIGHYVYISSVQACMITETGVQEILQPINDIRNKIIIFELVFTALVVFLGFYVVQRAFKPINNAIVAANEYGQGNFDHTVPVISDDEFGDLSKTINKMAGEIRISRDRISVHSQELENTVQARTAELEKTLLKQKETQAAMTNMLEDLNDALNNLKNLDVMKGQFLNNAAHELKTPLIPILGYTELALGGKMGKLSKAELETLTIIERNAKRLQHLIDEVLDVSKLESKNMMFDMKRMNLVNVLNNSVEDITPFANEKKIYLKLDAPKNVVVLGDEKRLTQVVVNLVNNAVKFTDKGGVSVVCEVDKKSKQVIVKIADTGIGLEENDMDKLFTKFFQADSSAKRKYAGSGLGLSICRGMIEEHGGKVWAESKFGKGSTFTFTLPLFGAKKKDNDKG